MEDVEETWEEVGPWQEGKMTPADDSIHMPQHPDCQTHMPQLPDWQSSACQNSRPSDVMWQESNVQGGVEDQKNQLHKHRIGSVGLGSYSFENQLWFWLTTSFTQVKSVVGPAQMSA